MAEEPRTPTAKPTGIGTTAQQLYRLFRVIVVCVMALLVLGTVSTAYLLESERELENTEHFSGLLLQLDRDLLILLRNTEKVLYRGESQLIPEVLTISEDMLNDYDAIVAQRELEQHIRVGPSAEEHHAAVLKLRGSLAQAMLLARSGDLVAAGQLFESGPRFYIRQLRNYTAEVLEGARRHIDIHGQELDELQIPLLIIFWGALFALLALLYYAFWRLSTSTNQLESNLMETVAKATSLERLSALGEVAGTISHELRNPLGTIRTSVFSLSQKLESANLGTEEIIERIERSVVRCDAIVSNLLDYVRRSPLALAEVDLRDWLLALLAEQQKRDGVAVELRGEDVGRVTLHPEKMRQAVINVIDNACDAISEAADREADSGGGTLQITLKNGGEQVRMEFLDTGSGIEPENLDRVFEPLFSTKTFGVGLGLPIVQQIMQQHGGGVEVESDPGGGCRVSLWWPRKIAHAPSLTLPG